jgi:hypothetical protein
MKQDWKALDKRALVTQEMARPNESHPLRALQDSMLS